MYLYMSKSITAIIAELKKASISDIFISSHANESVDKKLLDKLITCISKTHDVIELTSALPGFEKNAVNVENARTTMNKLIFERIKNWGDIDQDRLLLHLNTAIKSQKAGNCYEYHFTPNHF